MAEEYQHINYSAQDIEKYLKGQLSAAEMHAMEKAAHEDPFLAEALEGYMNAGDKNVTASLAEIKTKLHQRNFDTTPIVPIRRRNNWLSVAAAVLLIMGAATTWYLLRPTETDSIAQQKKKSEPVINKDSSVTQDEVARATDTAVSTPKISAAKADTNVLPQTRLNYEPAKKNAENNSSAKNLTAAPEANQTEDEINTKELRAIVAEQAGDVVSELKKNRATQELPRPRAVTRQMETESRAAQYDPPTIKTYVFTGSITDSNKQALPFVNVSIPNTNVNTYSDARGHFRVVAGDSSISLHLKAIGYIEKNIELAQTDGNVSIKMQAVNTSMDDVVVVGYGSKKQKANADYKKNNEENEAEPIDGWTNYDTYLQNNVRLQNTSSAQQQGSVELSFTVDAYGNPYDFKVDLSSCLTCEKEAIRLIKQGPRWKIQGTAKTAKVSLTMYF